MHKVFYVSLVILVLAGCTTVNQIPSGSDLMLFDSIQWKEAKSTTDTSILDSDIRQKMMADLINNVLPGKTGTQIYELLGDSDKSPDLQHLKADFLYCTGWERGNYFPGIDSEWLMIFLDNTGYYRNYKIIAD